ncbi:MAG TPA: division/cell wall cluster transcriptional repressor MraZ [Alphaproteobacteria bacterium]|nr:division/cell wall cluster transcriptional repressor MraZ [Alphaproteobacteria bacterium]
MATFVGSYENKVDAKGRVSVPARFRDEIREQSYQGVVVSPSADPGAIDACDYLRLTDVSAALDDPDLYTQDERLRAERIIARSTLLPFDENGRVMLPQALIGQAGIEGMALFTGIGPTFQIWHPERRAAFEAETLDRDQAAGASLRLLPKVRRPSTL